MKTMLSAFVSETLSYTVFVLFKNPTFYSYVYVIPPGYKVNM